MERGARGLSNGSIGARDGVVGSGLGAGFVEWFVEAREHDGRALGLGARERGRHRIGREDGVLRPWRAAARGRARREVGLCAGAVGVAAFQARVVPAPTGGVGHGVQFGPADGDGHAIPAVVQAREAAGGDERHAWKRSLKRGLVAHDHQERLWRQRQRPGERVGGARGVAQDEPREVDRAATAVDDLDPLVARAARRRIVQNLVDDDLACGGRLREGLWREKESEGREENEAHGAGGVHRSKLAPEARGVCAGHLRGASGLWRSGHALRLRGARGRGGTPRS